MLTRCPNCQTIYRIHTEQLEMADGQAHCCRCDQIFDAKESLQEQSFSTLDNDSDFADITDTYRCKLMDDKESELEESETVEESYSTNIGETIDPPEREILAPTSEEKEQTPPPEAAIQEPEREPDAQHPDAVALSVEELLAPPKKKRSLIATLFWCLGSLTLLTLALGQLAWFQRERIIQYPEGRLLLEQVCAYAECIVPQLRDTSRIQITSRQITSHPHEKNALLVQLAMVNNASFSQPYPLLELTLSTADNHLAARRSFKPEEYLSKDKESIPLMPTGASQHIEMEMGDPGKDVTGFEFNFF